jgi:hypothetical protein
MRKLRLTGVAGLAVAAVLIPAGAADAKQSTTGCPKKWQPAPTMALPPGQFENRDHNNNGTVCVKGPQGSNEHFNVKDDNTNQTVAPVFWYQFLFDETAVTEDVFIVIDNMNLYPFGTYLDPAPEDVTDDDPR